MIAQLLAAVLLIGFVSSAFSAALCPPTDQNKEWSGECFVRQGDDRRVRPKFVKNLRVNHYGKTTILITSPRELVAVDREGKVIIPNIMHTGDFDYPNAHLDIGRFYSHSKDQNSKYRRCGYFEAARYTIIVPARFDHCQPFKDQHAFACVNCVSYCSEPDCQDSILIGGQGTMLSSDGKTQKTFTLPTLDTVCIKRELVRITKLSNGAAMLKCLNGPDNPFKEM